jgi:hypothetical protein
MPRVHRVKANKDHPSFGIAKGDLHYTWSLKTGPRSSRTFRQINPPRPSQLTTSDFLGKVGDLCHDGFDGVESGDCLRDIAEEVRGWGSEEGEKLENMPDGLREGPTGETLRERAEGCDAWASEIDSAADELDEALEAIEKREAKVNGEDGEGEDDDSDDDDSEDDEHTDFDSERNDAISEAVEKASGASPF